MTRILYIAGDGRSGSTLLSTILSAHPEVVSVGELGLLHQDWFDTRFLCGCGLPYAACPFWKDLVIPTETAGDLPRVIRRIERRLSLPRLLLGRFSKSDRGTYASYQQRVFQYIAARSKKPIVVDSSKSSRPCTGRFLALRKLAGHDVTVVHLVRSGLSTMESEVITGNNWVLEGRLERPPRLPGLRAALGWMLANAWVPALARSMGPGRYLRIHYEDLLAEPALTLRQIGDLCGLDFGEAIERILRNESFEVGHVVGGNRERLKKHITMRRTVGGAAGSRLKWHQRLTFELVAGWLQRFYYG
jgi:hypothetical protein